MSKPLLLNFLSVDISFVQFHLCYGPVISVGVKGVGYNIEEKGII